MNKRMMKKAEKRRRRDIHRILDMVLDINGLDARMKSKTGDLPTAFFEYSGHVTLVAVRVYKNGWYPEADPDIRLEEFTKDPNGTQNLHMQLEEYIQKNQHHF